MQWVEWKCGTWLLLVFEVEMTNMAILEREYPKENTTASADDEGNAVRKPTNNGRSTGQNKPD